VTEINASGLLSVHLFNWLSADPLKFVRYLMVTSGVR